MDHIFAALQRRWGLVIMWLGLIIATGYTSSATIQAISNGYIPLITELLVPYSSGLATRGSGITTWLVAFLVLLSVITYLLVDAWLSLAQLTTELIVAYAQQDDADKDSDVFVEMLEFPEDVYIELEEDRDPAPEQANSTLVSQVIRRLAQVWAVGIGGSIILIILLILPLAF